MTMTDPLAAANALLSGSGAPAMKFEKADPQTGDSVAGKILSAEPRHSTEFGTNKPLFWDDGTPRMEIVLTLQTEWRNFESCDRGNREEDDGQRRLFLRGDLLKATKAALTKAKVQGLAIGGTYGARLVGREKKNSFEEKKYAVAYKAPEVSMPADGPAESNGAGTADDLV